MSEKLCEKNRINVVGLGVGNIDYLTGAGIKCIKQAEILIGGERHLKDISPLLNENQEGFILKNLSETIEFINKNRDKKITVIVSGDTGFYSLLNYLKKNLSDFEFNTVPGISSFQYLFAKLGESWEHYHLYSVHGRKINITDALKNSTAGIILLTDSKNSPYIIGRILNKNNFSDVKIIVGENLSYPDEKITEFYARDFEAHKRDYEMNVLILKKS